MDNKHPLKHMGYALSHLLVEALIVGRTRVLALVDTILLRRRIILRTTTLRPATSHITPFQEPMKLVAGVRHQVDD